MSIRVLCVPLLVLCSLQATAADIAREVVTSSDRSEAYAEIGLAFTSANVPLIGLNDSESVEESDDTTLGLEISLDGRIRYKNLFIEYVQDSFSAITLGYILANSNSSSLELIGTNLFPGLERDNIAGLGSITDRDPDFNLGFRYSTYHENNIFQVELMSDVADSHNGIVGALHAGRQKQIRNWNLHGLLSLRYFSDQFIDHYFGVSPEETTTAIAEYTGKAGILPSVKFGAILPLSEKWLFKAQAEYFHLPDSIVDSPLAQGDSTYFAQVGVAYVFGRR